MTMEGMMDLAKIKELRQGRSMAAHTGEAVDWLIAEVERLTARQCDAGCCNSRFVRAESVRP